MGVRLAYVWLALLVVPLLPAMFVYQVVGLAPRVRTSLPPPPLVSPRSCSGRRRTVEVAPVSHLICLLGPARACQSGMSAALWGQPARVSQACRQGFSLLRCSSVVIGAGSLALGLILPE